MRNCIVAQSGGPSAVINASALGVLSQNKETNYYDHVYAGFHGIEGILKEKIIDFSALPFEEIKNFKYTPSSGLGSCRYKMKNFREDDNEYKKLFEILDKLDIQTFFYIGGNDSMDTVHQLSEYVKLHNLKTQIIGIPKTIDNDLAETDHTPGFGSAAKLISTVALETYLDSCVYSNNGIFILETMGRDTGWLASSAALATLDGKPVADFIYLPEVAFSKEQFLKDVKEKFDLQNQVYIVASEGIKDENGKFLAQMSTAAHDKFGHAQLGGVCGALKNLITEAGITSRVKTLELGVIQRSAMHCASMTDIEEAHMVGRSAVTYSMEGNTGYMVAINRTSNAPYQSEAVLVEASAVANHVKYFPTSWINAEGNHVTEEALNYLRPLILGTPNLEMNMGLPQFVTLDKKAVLK